MNTDPRFPTPFPPAFASAWGDDAYGLFADFSVPSAEGEPISQRLRWIEPGEFLMGSPDDEVKRISDEGPQHLVTLTEGFWLADTVCTQALWQVVMKDSPSYFQGRDLPVEQVGWFGAIKFLKRLELLLPGCAVSLPTEAEWEYACRSGTQSAYFFGDEIEKLQVNFESDQTVAANKFLPNAWGLYQMHGNVWEWCVDGMRAYDGKAQHDPRGPGMDNSAVPRVVRGGGWANRAWEGRSAHRFIFGPGYRSRHLGFRFLLRSR